MLDWASQIWQSIRRLLRLTLVKGVVWGVIAFFLTQIISSMIQDTFPKWMRDVFITWLTKSTTLVNWLLVLMVLLFVLAITVTYRLSKTDAWLDPKDVRTLKYAAEYLHYKGFLELLTNIDNEIRQLLSKEKRVEEVDLMNFIDSFFIRTFEFFGMDVKTGVIFRPKEDDSNWLVGWKASPGHYLTEKKFYIGQNRESFTHRGSAGEAFVKNIPQRYNIINPLTGDADNPSKKSFPEYEKKRGGADYLSSINLPIRWNKHVVGVLAIDSKKRNFFTDEDIEMIQIIADRIGDALYLHQELK